MQKNFTLSVLNIIQPIFYEDEIKFKTDTNYS